MALYNIYSGMGGGFGGAVFQTQEEFNTQKEATNYAYASAVEDYTSYEGCNGIMSEEDCRREVMVSYGYDEEEIEDMELTPEMEGEVQDMYQNEIESWIDYRAVLADEDPNKEEVENELAGRN